MMVDANSFVSSPSDCCNKGNKGEVMSSLYKKFDDLMDARYNRYLDNGVIRMSLVVVAFAAWMVGGVALLKLV